MATTLTPEEVRHLLSILQARFESNIPRHSNLSWIDIQTKLETNPSKLWSLSQMEVTGGQPDVVDYNKTTHEYLFVDCSSESPMGRRSLCYDHQALVDRKVAKPKSSAQGMAELMDIDILTEDQYRHLQTLGTFDIKSSSWLLTPREIRQRGGAIFGDRRYDHVFIYHNGADSYYAARGFRGILRV